MASVIGDKALNLVISHLEGVHEELKVRADEFKVKGEALLAPHTKTGNAHLEVESGDVDVYLALVDEGGDAIAIERGHGPGGFNRTTEVEGLFILARATGLL
jgi:hypothetical protein